MISEQDFKVWLSDPVTMKFMDNIVKTKESIENMKFADMIKLNDFTRGIYAGQMELLGNIEKTDYSFFKEGEDGREDS